MEKVILLAEAEEMLQDLIFILFKEKYFSFLQNSLEYVDLIYDFIYTVPTQGKKPHIETDMEIGIVLLK